MSIRSLTTHARPHGAGPAIRRRMLQLVELLFLWEERHRARLRLATLDERMLHDIGVGRGAALAESRKPFWLA